MCISVSCNSRNCYKYYKKKTKKERKKTKDEVEYSEVAEKNSSIMKKKKVVKFSCQTEIRRQNKNEPNSLPDIIFFYIAGLEIIDSFKCLGLL